MSVNLENYQEVRQLVDWSAAIWAGFIAGIAFLLLYVVIWPLVIGGRAIDLLRYLASIVIGPDAAVDASPAMVLITALIVHFVLSIIWSIIIAIIIHRWGMVVGIFLGGLLGFAIYGINFISFASLPVGLWPEALSFPWFSALNAVSPTFMAIIHIIFGAVAGGAYEYLEVEYFVPVAE